MPSATFEIPGLPPSLNRWSRQHWAVRRRLAEEWRHRVALYSPRRLHATAPCLVQLEFVRAPGVSGRGQAVDPDNVAKFVLDGLTSCGIIPGDGPKSISELRLRSRMGEHDCVLVSVTWGGD